MSSKIKATYTKYINTEACRSQDNEQVLILSFEGKDDKVVDIAVNLVDAEDLVADVLAAMALHGNEQAVEISERYFGKNF